MRREVLAPAARNRFPIAKPQRFNDASVYAATWGLVSDGPLMEQSRSSSAQSWLNRTVLGIGLLRFSVIGAMNCHGYTASFSRLSWCGRCMAGYHRKQ